MNLSKHWIANEELYQHSIYKSFKQFIGTPEDFVFLGLLPNYLERQNSSLVYMVDFLMKTSSKEENGYFYTTIKSCTNFLMTYNDKTRR